jgi:hypothetical protein
MQKGSVGRSCRAIGSKILSSMVHQVISHRVVRGATYDPGHWTFYFWWRGFGLVVSIVVPSMLVVLPYMREVAGLTPGLDFFYGTNKRELVNTPKSYWPMRTWQQVPWHLLWPVQRDPCTSSSCIIKSFTPMSNISRQSECLGHVSCCGTPDSDATITTSSGYKTTCILNFICWIWSVN